MGEAMANLMSGRKKSDAPMWSLLFKHTSY
jgi:hypothetical protein